MQSAALPAVLESDANLVLASPTASGKTAIAEAAIAKTLSAGGTACFLAPMRALTNEKEREWARFEALGYTVEVVTGERDLDPARARRADVLVMTPEKADSATRKHDSRRYDFVTEVDTVVIDEVHLLDSDRRGSVLEVTIARFRRLCDPRIVALSATMQNVAEVADWLDAPESATFAFDDSYRPVPLEAGVETYTHGDNAFADKYRRLYRALDLVEPHLREDGQALVFVASRQDTVRAAEKTRDELAERDVPVGARGDYDFHTDAEALSDDTLRQSVLDGVGFHHAGLATEDKNLVEEWFRDGTLDVLFSTSTLAWGVNLPARCVVIRDTKLHDPLDGEVEMSPLDVLQMLGRAGRPEYDDVGYAWVVCDRSDERRYRRLLAEGRPIESRLADDLETHLNAEIALGTITSISGAMDWIGSTFFAVRAGDDRDVRATVVAAIEGLVEHGFVERDGDRLESTARGRLASKLYLRLQTAHRFARIATEDDPNDRDLLRAIATAEEFDSVSARSAESDAIEAVLGTGANAGEDLDAGARKVLAICEASLSGTIPAALKSDAWVIKQNALRLCNALAAFLDRFGTPERANRARRLEARLEHGISADAIGLTAVDGIGASRARKLAASEIASPWALQSASIESLEAAGLSAGVAERVHEQSQELPAIDIDWEGLPDRIAPGDQEIRELPIESVGGGAHAGIRVTANGREMTSDETYLGETTVPIALFGADTDAIEIEISVTFPREPLPTVRESRTVVVE
ncbi:DEAD/DEAH box helicase [Halococcoides cellulosivorans]|uniref:DEAD/DEAH box helicase n=2 Tax=Halococcoides cellulosivorans TaxID=1679096 RepID=A0A2R4X4D2_9EURY|nr:DEAD/DEAH box helicase [Halococcoides cellulosivorans]